MSAIAIIAGVAFGRKSGFMVGALAALASNFLRPRPVDTVANVCLGFGWLWGRVARDGACKAAGGGVEGPLSACSGEATGIASDSAYPVSPGGETESAALLPYQARTDKENRACSTRRLIDAHPTIVYAYGFLACLGYGFILNAWSILSFFHAQASGWAGILAVYATALPFDIVHGVATVVFLLALAARGVEARARAQEVRFGIGAGNAANARHRSSWPPCLGVQGEARPRAPFSNGTLNILL